MIRPAVFCLALSMLAVSGYSASASEGDEIVYCHDTARQLVQRVRLKHCSGRLVTAQQASDIHARIEFDRRTRQARIVARTEDRNRTGIRFKSAGAAFAVNGRGELLTSAHVVRGCDVLEARNNAGTKAHSVRIKAIAETSDLAVVSIDATTPDILPFAGESPADGSPLALIGYPAEGMIRRTPRLTPVLVSHAISHPSRYGLVGIAGDVRRGNSGGPALDSRGRAVGVLKAKINTVAAHKRTGRILTDLGVIVETSRVLQFLQKSKTPYSIARDDTAEKSGRSLFERGSRAVYRIDCLERSEVDGRQAGARR